MFPQSPLPDQALLLVERSGGAAGRSCFDQLVVAGTRWWPEQDTTTNTPEIQHKYTKIQIVLQQLGGIGVLF